MVGLGEVVLAHTSPYPPIVLLSSRLKPLAGGPGLPSVKCTSAAAPTQQQMVDCGDCGFKSVQMHQLS